LLCEPEVINGPSEANAKENRSNPPVHGVCDAYGVGKRKEKSNQQKRGQNISIFHRDGLLNLLVFLVVRTKNSYLNIIISEHFAEQKIIDELIG
jgi:hypothetical protein